MRCLFIYLSISLLIKLSGGGTNYRMSSKHVANSFEDYSDASAKDIISGNKVRPDSIIYTQESNFWKNKFNKNKVSSHSSDYTVYTGTAGIALYYLKRSERYPDLLQDALEYLPLQKLKNNRITFLCGDSGPLAIAAVIHHKLGNQGELQNLVQKLVNMSHEVLDIKSDLPNELLYGRAGYLYSLLFVNEHIDSRPIDESLIRKIIKIILQVGQRGAKSTDLEIPLMYHWHGKHYLGAAHGLSGILYMLLQAARYVDEADLRDLVRPSVDYLQTLQYPSGNYMSSLNSDSDRLVQWCHGAPGFTHLFCQAYKVFNDDKYLKMAQKCGDVVWERGLLRKGYSLCHGVAGNAYSFLELYRTTQEAKHLYRAVKFTEWCMEEHTEQHPPDRPGSLFEGIAGRMYLIEDMRDPMLAKFPAYAL